MQSTSSGLDSDLAHWSKDGQPLPSYDIYLYHEKISSHDQFLFCVKGFFTSCDETTIVLLKKDTLELYGLKDLSHLTLNSSQCLFSDIQSMLTIKGMQESFNVEDLQSLDATVRAKAIRATGVDVLLLIGQHRQWWLVYDNASHRWIIVQEELRPKSVIITLSLATSNTLAVITRSPPCHYILTMHCPHRVECLIPSEYSFDLQSAVLLPWSASEHILLCVWRHPHPSMCTYALNIASATCTRIHQQAIASDTLRFAPPSSSDSSLVFFSNTHLFVVDPFTVENLECAIASPVSITDACNPISAVHPLDSPYFLITTRNNVYLYHLTSASLHLCTVNDPYACKPSHFSSFPARSRLKVVLSHSPCDIVRMTCIQKSSENSDPFSSFIHSSLFLSSLDSTHVFDQHGESITSSQGVITNESTLDVFALSLTCVAQITPTGIRIIDLSHPPRDHCAPQRIRYAAWLSPILYYVTSNDFLYQWHPFIKNSPSEHIWTCPHPITCFTSDVTESTALLLIGCIHGCIHVLNGLHPSSVLDILQLRDYILKSEREDENDEFLLIPTSLNMIPSLFPHYPPMLLVGLHSGQLLVLLRMSSFSSSLSWRLCKQYVIGNAPVRIVHCGARQFLLQSDSQCALLQCTPSGETRLFTLGALSATCMTVFSDHLWYVQHHHGVQKTRQLCIAQWQSTSNTPSLLPKPSSFSAQTPHVVAVHLEGRLLAKIYSSQWQMVCARGTRSLWMALVHPNEGILLCRGNESAAELVAVQLQRGMHCACLMSRDTNNEETILIVGGDVQQRLVVMVHERDQTRELVNVLKYTHETPYREKDSDDGFHGNGISWLSLSTLSTCSTGCVLEAAMGETMMEVTVIAPKAVMMPTMTAVNENGGKRRKLFYSRQRLRCVAESGQVHAVVFLQREMAMLLYQLQSALEKSGWTTWRNESDISLEERENIASFPSMMIHGELVREFLSVPRGVQEQIVNNLADDETVAWITQVLYYVHELCDMADDQ